MIAALAQIGHNNADHGVFIILQYMFSPKCGRTDLCFIVGDTDPINFIVLDAIYDKFVERFTSKMEADIYRGRFRLNQEIYTRYCQPNTVIMHPLPRDSRAEANELDNDLNQHPSLAIFRQTDNGILVRMALFALVLDVTGQIEKSAREVNWYTERRF